MTGICIYQKAKQGLLPEVSYRPDGLSVLSVEPRTADAAALEEAPEPPEATIPACSTAALPSPCLLCLARLAARAFRLPEAESTGKEANRSRAAATAEAEGPAVPAVPAALADSVAELRSDCCGRAAV